jgi:BRCT domain type II-containing protein
MSKIKQYAIDQMGEDGFQEYLDNQMKGGKNGKRA